MPEFLLEIGCEELPAPWLPGLAEQLATHFGAFAGAARLEPTTVATCYTPRRLVLHAELAAGQADLEETLWGPSLKVAKDASGNWTPAAHGFARKCGVGVDVLRVAPKPTASGAPSDENRHLSYPKLTSGRDAKDVLPGVLCASLRALSFPKRMNWDAWLEDGRGAFPFGRPIRWLVVLLGGEVVPFTIFEARAGARGPALVEAGRTTRGHRFLPAGAEERTLSVGSYAELEAGLRRLCVLVEPAERERKIRAELASLGARVGVEHEDLIHEWRDLVEHPTILAGDVPHALRTLPAEVLATVLVHHQKYLPLGAAGEPAPRFAAVTNTDGTHATAIVRGMQRVVVARLRDAAFFYEEDRKRPLAQRAHELSGITFHQGLGSFKDKTERIVRLVDAMGAEMRLLTKPEHTAAREAAALCKADLTTQMVREFPELQGVMGSIYLRAEGGVWDTVATAVRWHYHPLSAEQDALPAKRLAGTEATVFGAVSLADKLDTLAGYFGLGLVPTGSNDPYALRRAATGVVRVLLDFWNAAEAESRPDLRRLVAVAAAGYGSLLQRKAPDVARDVESFLADRLRYVLAMRGFPADEIEAAMAAQQPEALADVFETAVRLEALHRVRQEAAEDFSHLAFAFKRAKNILAGVTADAVDPALFEGEAERELHTTVVRLGAGSGDYAARLRALAALRTAVDRFFDDVLVMAEDPKLRANRLGLLARTLSLFYRIADISKLGG